MTDNIAAAAENASLPFSAEELARVESTLREKGLIAADADPVIGEVQVSDLGYYLCTILPEGVCTVRHKRDGTPMADKKLAGRIVFRYGPYRGDHVSDWISYPTIEGEWKIQKDGAWVPYHVEGQPYWKKLREEWTAKRTEIDKAAKKAAWRSSDKVAAYAARHWTIARLIEKSSVAWIYGLPGSLKTFTALDMACCVATGQDWCGRPTGKGPVLYVSAEGGDGIHVRREAWEIDRGCIAEDLKIVQISPDMTVPFNNRHSEILLELNELVEVTGEQPALLVLDTFAQTAPGDTKEAVTAYIKNCMDLAAKRYPGMAVLVIDHTTKEGGTWMGSQAKLGNVDMMGAVVRTETKDSDAVVLTMRNSKGKVKNAAPFNDIKLSPRSVNLGIQDAEGQELTSLVLDYQEYSLTDNESALLDLIGDSTTYGELRASFKEHITSTAKKKLDAGAIRQAFARAFDKLITLENIKLDPDKKADNSYVFVM